MGRNERGHTTGYAWVWVPGVDDARAAIASHDHKLTLNFTVGFEHPSEVGTDTTLAGSSTNGNPNKTHPSSYTVLTGPLLVGIATDKRDILFPDLPRSARLRLLFDGTSLYSVTDSPTADRIGSILECIVSATEGGGLLPSDSDLSSFTRRRGVAVIDAFACVGGSAIAFARKASLFRRVVAVELDSKRAAMLQHNINVALLHAEESEGEQEEAGTEKGKEEVVHASNTGTGNTVNPTSDAAALTKPEFESSLGRDLKEGREAWKRVEVVEGDCVSVLLPSSSPLSSRHACEVVFLDPPWGGMNYSSAGTISDLHFSSTPDKAASLSSSPEGALSGGAAAGGGGGGGGGGGAAAPPLSPPPAPPSAAVAAAIAASQLSGQNPSPRVGLNSLVVALGKQQGGAAQMVAIRLPLNYDVDGLARLLVASPHTVPSACGNPLERPLPFLLKLGPKALLLVVCFTPRPLALEAQEAGHEERDELLRTAGSAAAATTSAAAAAAAGAAEPGTPERVDGTQLHPPPESAPLLNLNFGLNSLDAVIAALAKSDKGPWRLEHSPKFFDYEADRWIRCRDWKGCSSAKSKN